MRTDVYSRKLSQLKQVIVHFGVFLAAALFGLIAGCYIDFSTEESGLGLPPIANKMPQRSNSQSEENKSEESQSEAANLRDSQSETAVINPQMNLGEKGRLNRQPEAWVLKCG